MRTVHPKCIINSKYPARVMSLAGRMQAYLARVMSLADHMQMVRRGSNQRRTKSSLSVTGSNDLIQVYNDVIYSDYVKIDVNYIPHCFMLIFLVSYCSCSY